MKLNIFSQAELFWLKGSKQANKSTIQLFDYRIQKSIFKMETEFPGVSYLDCVDKLLYPQEFSKSGCLPVLGHLALEQVGVFAFLDFKVWQITFISSQRFCPHHLRTRPAHLRPPDLARWRGCLRTPPWIQCCPRPITTPPWAVLVCQQTLSSPTQPQTISTAMILMHSTPRTQFHPSPRSKRPLQQQQLQLPHPTQAWFGHQLTLRDNIASDVRAGAPPAPHQVGPIARKMKIEISTVTLYQNKNVFFLCRSL